MGLLDRFRSKHEERPLAEPPERLLSYRTANLQGIGNREGQEDSFAFVNGMDVMKIREEGLFALVADGMGGMEDGKAVSETASALMQQSFQAFDRQQELSAQLVQSVFSVNERLAVRFGGSGGTTLVACLFFREKLYFVSVGDSYLYLKRGSGIYRINQEHTWRQELYLAQLEKGVLEPEEADADPDAPRLSQFLGMQGLEKIDSFRMPLPLQAGDVILLCSDGIGGVLNAEELLECMKDADPEEALFRMDEKVRQKARPHQDNYTALAIVCGY